ncbi:hypothetical protein ASE63_05810 [Bosea sp. Root381]|nr:hypothetical protein ASE63_05810 [Bosea sp. Root381]
MTVQRERRVEIQWLRAVAACEVVICHSSLLTKHFTSSVPIPAWYQPLSAIGVELFFIVSGYVICMRVGESDGARPFLVARILRLYPMYWIFTCVAVLAYLLNPAWHLNNFTFELLPMAKSFLILPQTGFPILGVGWTLEHEMVFYVFVAVMLLTIGGSNRAKLSLAWLLAGLGAVGAVLGTPPHPLIAGAPGADSTALLSHVFSPFMFAFGLGWLARVLEDGRSSKLWIDVLPFILFAIGALWLAPEWGRLPLLRIAIAALVFAGFLACRGRFADTPLNRLIWQLGDASFSIYLSHWFLLSAGGKLMGHLDPPDWLELPVRIVGVGASIAFGLVVFLLIEKPLDRKLRRRPATLPVAAPVPSAP